MWSLRVLVASRASPLTRTRADAMRGLFETQRYRCVTKSTRAAGFDRLQPTADTVSQNDRPPGLIEFAGIA